MTIDIRMTPHKAIGRQYAHPRFRTPPQKRGPKPKDVLRVRK